MLCLGNPPSSGLELYDSRGCATAPPDYSFPERFREVTKVFRKLFFSIARSIRTFVLLEFHARAVGI